MQTSEFYSFEDIQRAGKVVPLQKVKEVLNLTEPVEEHFLKTDGTSKVTVTMPEHWNLDLKAMDDSVLTLCTFSYGGREYLMSKRAILSLLNMIGISDHYAYKTPGHLLAPHLNYWFENEGVGRESELKMVTKDDYTVGFMRTSYPIISNLEVLKQIETYLKKTGMKQELYVDPHIVNNFVQTEFRIILSDEAFEVETERNGVTETDKWHYGIHVSNSLTSNVSKPLTLSGFMVEQRSLSGILPEYSGIAGYSRATDMDVEDLRGWIHSTLDQVLSILPAEAEMIKHMPQHTLSGKIGPLTTDLFRSMKVHRKVQELALENLTVSGDMTSYGIMHAMSKAVSNSAVKFPTKIVNHVQRVCGTLPSRADEICDSCGRLHLFD